MEPINQMPPNPMQMPPQPAGNGHVCKAGCWHSIVFGLIILIIVAGGAWWYMNQYQAPSTSTLQIQDNAGAPAVTDEDGALEAELEAANFDSLDQESAALEAELQ